MKPLFFFLFAIFTCISNLYAQTFTGRFDLVATQHYPNGNMRHDTISYNFGNHKTAIKIYGRRNNPDMRMVFSTKDSTITTLFEMNGKKGGFILPMDEKHWPGMVQAFKTYSAGNDKPLNYTGKTKTIEGYACREILAENDAYAAKLWITEAINLSMTHVLSYQSVGKGKQKKEIELFEQFGITALPLQMHLKSKNGKADVVIAMINFNDTPNENSFDTSGHTLGRVD